HQRSHRPHDCGPAPDARHWPGCAAALKLPVCARRSLGYDARRRYMGLSSETGKELLASDVRVPLEDAAFLQAVLEAVPAFIVRLDPERRISYINLLREGVTLPEVIGQPALDFIQPEHHERFHAAVEQALSTGQSASYRVTG